MSNKFRRDKGIGVGNRFQTNRWRTRKRKRRVSLLQTSIIWLTNAWKWALSTSLVLATLLGYFVLVPRIGVTPSESLNPAEAYSTPFEIENQGTLPIYDVHADYLINQSNFLGGGGIQGIVIDNLSSGRSSSGFPSTIRKLGPGEKVTFDSASIKGPVQEANITVEITFRVWLLGSERKEFRFQGSMQKDGRLHWYPDAVGE